ALESCATSLAGPLASCATLGSGSWKGWRVGSGGDASATSLTSAGSGDGRRGVGAALFSSMGGSMTGSAANPGPSLAPAIAPPQDVRPASARPQDARERTSQAAL